MCVCVRVSPCVVYVFGTGWKATFSNLPASPHSPNPQIDTPASHQCAIARFGRLQASSSRRQQASSHSVLSPSVRRHLVEQQQQQQHGRVHVCVRALIKLAIYACPNRRRGVSILSKAQHSFRASGSCRVHNPSIGSSRSLDHRRFASTVPRWHQWSDIVERPSTNGPRQQGSALLRRRFGPNHRHQHQPLERRYPALPR